jgi:hypothetical protein
MHHTVVVGESESVGDLRGDVRDPVGGEDHTEVEHRPQRASLQEFHGDVRDAVALADVVDRDDVGVTETPCGSRFAIEAPFERLELVALEFDAYRLQSERAVEQRVAGLVYGAHGAVTDFLEYFVATDALGCHRFGLL